MPLGGKNSTKRDIGFLSSEEKKKVIQGLKQMSDSFTRDEAERDHRKSIVEDIENDMGVDPKLFKRLAKTFHKRNHEEEQAAYREYEEAYEALTDINDDERPAENEIIVEDEPVLVKKEESDFDFHGTL